MATTTTHYGFDIPQSTDLVKDGATAIATLGQDIDTAMNTALGTKKAGMVLLNTTSFSGVASQSISDVFSATYRNYLVVFDITTATATSGLQMRMRVSGADNSNSEYRYNSITAADTSATIATSRSNGTNTLFDDIGRIDNGFGSSGFINFFSPFATNRTRISGQSSGGQTSDVNALRSYTGNLTVTTSYTGFTLIAASGNITGEASVFGYNA